MGKFELNPLKACWELYFTPKRYHLELFRKGALARRLQSRDRRESNLKRETESVVFTLLMLQGHYPRIY